jgi:dolichyl-phosphate beta-glucosyltransferase
MILFYVQPQQADGSDANRTPRSNTCAVVVPCYNEAARLEIDTFREFAKTSPGVSFIFVNDGSTDSTLEVLRRLRNGLETSITIVDCPRNAGKGEAVRQGLIYALDNTRSDTVGFWDADLATPLIAIHDLLNVLDSLPEIQLVFGSRVKLLGRQIERRPIRHYLGRIFATVVSTALRLPIYDTQCGAKLFRATPRLREIVSEPFHSRWVFDVELIARFMHQYRSDPQTGRDAIYEFPLYAWRDVGGSKLRPRDFLRAIYDVVQITRRFR